MGNSVSQDFTKSFEKLNNIVTNIVNEKDMFKNRDYNFLSQDVCNQHFLLMEKELDRHLKVNINNLGSSLYLIPKDSVDTKKSTLCKQISRHYLKILYLVCLIKYVYNLEKYGEFSLSGIIFRNVSIKENLMEINFCNVAHKDFSKELKDAHKLDFSKLEGLQFFTEYFLDRSESNAFVKAMKRVFARAPKREVGDRLCEISRQTSREHVRHLEAMYLRRYGEKLVCRKERETSEKPTNLFMFVEKDNPVLSRDYCHERHKLVFETKSTGGRKMLQMYKDMEARHSAHLAGIQNLLQSFVIPEKNGTFTLKDITQQELHQIISRVKEEIKTYYIETLLDFQKLLDVGKNTPNINIMK